MTLSPEVYSIAIITSNQSIVKQFEPFVELLNGYYFMTNGTWRDDQVRTVRRAFHNGRIKELVREIGETCGDVLQRWQHCQRGELIGLEFELSRCVVDFYWKFVFGYRLGAAKGNDEAIEFIQFIEEMAPEIWRRTARNFTSLVSDWASSVAKCLFR